MKKNVRVMAAVGAAAALVLAPAAAASALPIESSGPLVRIDISETLNCAVNHVGDEAGEFFDNTACGTFVAVGGELFGPASIPAGFSAGQTAWTPGTQNSGGTGTAADPFAIVTEVTGGVLSVRQTDTYVTGDHHYASESVMTNTSDADVEVTLYRAADCYLGDNDNGFGAYDAATGAVSCVAPDGAGQPSAASRIEQFIPATAGSNYLYAGYDEVWSAVGSKQPLPNELRNAGTLMDNGMGLSWTVTIPAGGTVPIAMQTNFSPLDVTALTSSLTVSPAAIAASGTATVTARVANPNDSVQDLSSATITLPAGVEYVAGSVSGIAEPTISGDQLLFDGAGAEIAAGGAREFTFVVTSSALGVHSIGLAATVESRVDVAPSSAELTVGVPELPTLLSFDPETVNIGGHSTLTAGVLNEHGADFTVDGLTLTLPAGATYVAGSAQGIAEPAVHGNTLVFAGPILVEAESMFPFTLGVQAAVAGAQVFTLTGTSEGARVLESQATLTVEAAVVPPAPAVKKPAALANTGAETAPLYALGAVSGALVLGSAAALGFAAKRRHALK